MSIYKPSNNKPYLDAVDISAISAGNPLFFECKIDSSNTLVDGYSIELYDENNNLIFPIGGIQELTINNITLVSDLKAFYDEHYSSSGYEYLNEGVNGTYLRIPFIIDTADLGGTQPPTLMINSLKEDNGVIWDEDGNQINITNDSTYKWIITLYQLDDQGIPEAIKYYDMQLTTGVVLGSTAKRIQSKKSDKIFTNYFLQPTRVELEDGNDNPDGWEPTGGAEVENVGQRVLIDQYDQTYGYIYPTTGDQGVADGVIGKTKTEVAQNGSRANSFQIYKMSNNPEDLSDTQKVYAMPNACIPFSWKRNYVNPSLSYGEQQCWIRKKDVQADPNTFYPFELEFGVVLDGNSFQPENWSLCAPTHIDNGDISAYFIGGTNGFSYIEDENLSMQPELYTLSSLGLSSNFSSVHSPFYYNNNGNRILIAKAELKDSQCVVVKEAGASTSIIGGWHIPSATQTGSGSFTASVVGEPYYFNSKNISKKYLFAIPYYSLGQEHQYGFLSITMSNNQSQPFVYDHLFQGAISASDQTTVSTNGFAHKEGSENDLLFIYGVDHPASPSPSRPHIIIYANGSDGWKSRSHIAFTDYSGYSFDGMYMVKVKTESGYRDMIAAHLSLDRGDEGIEHVMLWRDYSDSWTAYNVEGSGWYSVPMPTSGSVITASANNHNIICADDGCIYALSIVVGAIDFKKIFDSEKQLGTKSVYTDIKYFPEDETILATNGPHRYGATDNITVLSKDGGASWTPFPKNTSAIYHDGSLVMTYAPTNSGNRMIYTFEKFTMGGYYWNGQQTHIIPQDSRIILNYQYSNEEDIPKTYGEKPPINNSPCEYNGIFYPRYSKVYYKDGTMISGPDAFDRCDYIKVIVSWSRCTDADTWGEISNKIVLVSGEFGDNIGRNVQIEQPQGTQLGTINETPFKFVQEKPLEIYDNADASWTNPYKNNTGIIFYNDLKTENNDGRLFIRPFQGIKSGMLWQQRGSLNDGSFKIKTVNEDYWYVTYGDASSGDTDFVTDETRYTISSFYKQGDEAPFYTRKTPVINIGYQDVDSNSVPTWDNPQILPVTSMNILVYGSYSQDDNVQWRSYQFSIINKQTNQILAQSPILYDKHIEYKFYGLDWLSDDDGEKYSVVLSIENQLGIRISTDKNILCSSCASTYKKVSSLGNSVELETEGESCDKNTTACVKIKTSDTEDVGWIYKREVWRGKNGESCHQDMYTPVVYADGTSKTYRDYNVSANRTYEYVFNGKGSHRMQLCASVVSTAWTGWTLTELHDSGEMIGQYKKYTASKSDIWRFKFNVSPGEQQQNIAKSQQDTLSKYPRFSNGKKNNISGQVTCLLGKEMIPFDFDNKEYEYIYDPITQDWIWREKLTGGKSGGGYKERLNGGFCDLTSNEAVDMLEAWRRVCYSGNPKLLKDQKGQSFIVQITGSSNQTNESWNKMPEQITFGWQQIDDSKNYIIVEDITSSN